MLAGTVAVMQVSTVVVVLAATYIVRCLLHPQLGYTSILLEELIKLVTKSRVSTMKYAFYRGD